MVPDTADDRTALDAITLPPEMAAVLARALPTDDRPTTLADVFDPPEALLPPDVPHSTSDMYQEEETPHAVYLPDDVQHVPCVLDALLVGFSTGAEPVRIESTSPVDGVVVEYRVADDEVSVTPRDAVVSFGVTPADATGLPHGDDAVAGTRFASCAYINSFPDARSYERWAGSTGAAPIMRLSVDEAAMAAREVVAGPLFD